MSINIVTPLLKESALHNPRDVLRQVLVSEDTYATTLLIIACDTYDGYDITQWHPQTIKDQLEMTFGIDMPKANFDKLMAAIAIVTTDLFFRNERAFVELANVLSGDDFQPDEFDPADSVECAWAITEALILDPPDEDNHEPFCDEIRWYIGKVLFDEGFMTPPDVLRIAVHDSFRRPPMYDIHGDPELHAKVQASQKAKQQEVVEAIREGLLELGAQLDALPLQNGKTGEFVARLHQRLGMLSNTRRVQ